MHLTVHLLADAPAQMLPARSLMAFTLASHITLVPMGVALPLITLAMHHRALRRGDATALLLARRWSAVMAVQFAIGVVTGTVLSFEFGLLWPGMMGRWGDVFGIGFGVEAWAFFLEAVLIAIYLYGWRRLTPRTHFLLGLPLPAAALLGAFGILAANSWMNTPQGFSQTRRLARRRVYGAVFAIASLLTPFFLGAAVGGIASGRVAPGTEASTDAWSNPTSILFGLLTVASTAFLGAVFLTADAARFDASDLVVYFRRRALAGLVVVAVLAVVTLAVTHSDAPHVWHGLTHGAGLALAIVSAVLLAATGLLLLRDQARWSRFSAVGVVGAAVFAWGIAQRPYLIPPSLTVADAAGDPTTLTWLSWVSLVALLLVGPAVFLLYRLDTHGELEPLTDADLRRSRPMPGDTADGD